MLKKNSWELIPQVLYYVSNSYARYGPGYYWGGSDEEVEKRSPEPKQKELEKPKEKLTKLEKPKETKDAHKRRP